MELSPESSLASQDADKGTSKMQLCDQFRALVDRSIAGLPELDEETIRRRYHDRFSQAPNQPNYEVFFSVIRDELIACDQETVPATVLFEIARALRLQTIEGLPSAPYVQIITFLRDALKNEGLKSLNHTASWVSAIDAARCNNAIGTPLPDIDVRTYAVRDAASRLIAAGYPVSVQNNQLYLDDKEEERLLIDLEGDIRKIGGGIVIANVLAYLRTRGDFSSERYVPGRSFSFSSRLPSLPSGYLLNLGAKNLTAPPVLDERIHGPIWQRIAERARDLCALYDVEPYNNIDGTFVDAKGLPAYLGRIALFDHIFSFRQWPPARTSLLLEELLRFVDTQFMRDKLGWTLADAIRLVQITFRLTVGHEMIAISETDLLAGGLKSEVWSRMRPAFVHSFGAVNHDYRKPTDADKSDFAFRPFVEIHRNQLFVATPAITALGFFEAITQAIRSAKYPNFDGELGYQVEHAVSKLFETRNIRPTIAGKKYSMHDTLTGGMQDGECDLVYETNSHIIFVEVKKQPHRRISSTGDALANLIDLSASLLASQVQLAQHERVLTANQMIVFKDGTRLPLAGRNIERITVTQLDYGGLQDKFLLKQIMEQFAGAKIGAAGVSTSVSRKIDELNSNLETLARLTQEMEKLGQPAREMFFNCWFFSLPQLDLLTQDLDGIDSFVVAIGKLRHITFRMLDFYREYHAAKKGSLI